MADESIDYFMALRSRAPFPPYHKFRCKMPGKMPAKWRFPEHVPHNEEREAVHVGIGFLKIRSISAIPQTSLR